MKKFLLTCIAVACSLVAVAEELLIEAESFSQRPRRLCRRGPGEREANGTLNGPIAQLARAHD